MRISPNYPYQFLTPYATDKKTLEIGSGGRNYARKFFPNLITLDIDESVRPDVVASAEDLPFPDNSFDTTLCNGVLEHTLNPQKAIDEIMRVCSRQAIFRMSFVYPYTMLPTDYWRTSEYGIRHFFRNYTITVLRPNSHAFATIASLLHKIICQTDMRGGKITKGIIWLFVQLFKRLDWIITQEYADIKRENPIDAFMPTGYFIVVEK